MEETLQSALDQLLGSRLPAVAPEYSPKHQSHASRYDRRVRSPNPSIFAIPLAPCPHRASASRCPSCGGLYGKSQHCRASHLAESWKVHDAWLPLTVMCQATALFCPKLCVRLTIP